jgi:hypothetical protein
MVSFYNRLIMLALLVGTTAGCGLNSPFHPLRLPEEHFVEAIGKG